MEGESYEELRKKRLEENKRKLEGLGLQHLSFSLQQATSPKRQRSLVKRTPPVAEQGLVVRRRSDRIANLPGYKEVPAVVTHGTIEYCIDRFGRAYASHEARKYAIDKAAAVQAGLRRAYPSFVKPMLQSHATGGFCGIPINFCKEHLPEHDSRMVLVDEDGHESDIVYIVHRGLSAGWRGFSTFHELADGDALVFQLIRATAFKVYIYRASSYDSS